MNFESCKVKHIVKLFGFPSRARNCFPVGLGWHFWMLLMLKPSPWGHPTVAQVALTGENLTLWLRICKTVPLQTVDPMARLSSGAES